MLKLKIHKILWILYILCYLCGLVYDVIYSYNQKYFYIGLVEPILIMTGMIGYVAKIKIAYRFVWSILFTISFVSFLLFIAAVILSAKYIMLLVLVLFFPALYALFAYAYRSGRIWEKTILIIQPEDYLSQLHGLDISNKNDK
jgi:hypothetical protein